MAVRSDGVLTAAHGHPLGFRIMTMGIGSGGLFLKSLFTATPLPCRETISGRPRFQNYH